VEIVSTVSKFVCTGWIIKVCQEIHISFLTTEEI
jgi:hypothetical protein